MARFDEWPEGERVRILIVLMGALGDVTRGLALVDQLKNRDRKPHITWIVEPLSESLVRMHPGVDEVIVFERHRGLLGAIKLFRDLKKHSFDITLDLQRHFKSGLVSYFSRAKRRIGFHPDNSKEFNWRFNTETLAQQADNFPKLEHYLLFMEALGLKVSRPLTWSFDANAPKLSQAMREQLCGPYSVIVLGSSKRSKDWTLEGNIALTDYLSKQPRALVALVGGKSNVATGAEIKRRLGSNKIIDLTGATTIPELVSVIKGAAFCVGPDSGPGHIAAAVGTPYVSLFGPTSKERNVPYENSHRAIVAGSGRMSDITPEEVIEMVKKVSSSESR